jgi:NAD(P)-dependent dehydrogenase (short-subunit alcohol dehydrogenase family)
MIRTPMTAAHLEDPATMEAIKATTPIGEVGAPEDIAAAVVFLASDEAGFITGQVLCVDGGALAHQPYVADFGKEAAA